MTGLAGHRPSLSFSKAFLYGSKVESVGAGHLHTQSSLDVLAHLHLETLSSTLIATSFRG